MLRAIVIDDVDLIRNKNIDLIKTHCLNVAVIAEANSVEAGVAMIKKLIPDLVFLDIEMTDGTGFDLLQQLKPISFKVIFITGHDNFAVRAFKVSAIDYLLKPLDPIELVEAVKKAELSLSKEMFDVKLNNLFSNIERPKDLQKIILKTQDKLHSVNIKDIVRCESFKNYTTFFLFDGQKIVVSTTIKEYELMLTPFNFFKTHQSHLINMNYFDFYLKSDSVIVLKDKSQVPLATRKKDEFFQLLDQK